MIKYDKSKPIQSSKRNSPVQRAITSTTDKKRSNKTLFVDLTGASNEQIPSTPLINYQKSSTIRTQQWGEVFEQNESPQETKNEQRIKHITPLEQQSVGRLTIKSINSVSQFEYTDKKKHLTNNNLSNNINSGDQSTLTPYGTTPIQRSPEQEVLSEEKMFAPIVKRGLTGNTNPSRGNLFEESAYQDNNLDQKRFSAKKERDSKILREKREPTETYEVVMIQDESPTHPIFRPSFADEDLEELPPISPVSRTSRLNGQHFKDNRFSIRQIKFNLISQLRDPLECQSFIGRASSKLMIDSNHSTLQNGNKSKFNNRCSKGLQSLFGCCANTYVVSSKLKDSNSYHSNNSSYIKVLPHYNDEGSFKNSSSIVVNTDEFCDEMDEYSNDTYSHRLSVIKRYNVNTSLFSPGTKMVQLSNDALMETRNLQQQQQNKLNMFVTKVPQCGIDLTTNANFPSDNKKNDDSNTSASQLQQQDIHRLHFLQTIQSLQFIKTGLTMPSNKEVRDKMVRLPPPNDPRKTKTIIFDMDETLIHCVDDIETEDPDVIIPIDFPDEDELVNAGVNIRPYIYECLEEANKYFQVIVFTASHKAYADAILDQIDPENKYFQHRLYRDNCIQTKEGFYVKDLRIIQNRRLEDLVIVDNSVYSFAFQIDNGIPIIPFYDDKEDEEMLHLIYYLNCLSQVEDVREQNKEAFELKKLAEQNPNDILNCYTNNNQQMLFQNQEDGDYQVIVEENEDTQGMSSDDDDDFEETRQHQYNKIQESPSSLLISYE